MPVMSTVSPDAALTSILLGHQSECPDRTQQPPVTLYGPGYSCVAAIV